MYGQSCNGVSVLLCIKPPRGTSIAQCMCMRVYVFISVCIWCICAIFKRKEFENIMIVMMTTGIMIAVYGWD